LAPLGPQAEQPRPVVTVFGSVQRSVQEPGVVPQPLDGSQAAAQHWLVGPTVQEVTISGQVHGTQVPAPSQVFVHEPEKSWNAPGAQ
jgi:hypothetical protein